MTEKVTLTKWQIGRLLDMGGSVLTPEECWKYNKALAGLPQDLHEDDVTNYIDFLEGYDETHFICETCDWPFELGEMAGDNVCENCHEEDE